MSLLRRILSVTFAALICLTAVISAGAVEYSGSDSYEDGDFDDALESVQLTGNARDDILNIAKSQRYYFGGGSADDLSGTPRKYGKYTEYGRAYGSVNSNWCGFFVSWCAQHAGIESTVLKQTGVANPVNFGLAGQSKLESAQSYTWSQFKNGTYVPKAGDLIFYGSSSASSSSSVPTTGYSHVGFITSVDYNADGSYWFHTIEGNTSVSGYDDDYRGVEFKTRKVSASNASKGYTGYWYIRAFGAPDYEKAGGSIGSGTNTEVFFTGKYITTAENGLIIRSLPSTDGERLGKIPYQTEVQITEITNKWGKVTYNGIEGFISLEYAEFADVPPAVNELRIEALPSKTEYQKGDTLVITGAKIIAVYEGGTEVDVTRNCKFTPAVLNVAGTQTVVITYENATASFEVNVTEPPKKELDLNDPSTYPSYTRTLKLTSPQMTGDDVIFVQTVLKSLGYDIDVDGAYGPATQSAVTSFQQNKEIDVDGKVGPQTWATLIDAINSPHIMITEITVTKLPDKTQYFVGEDLELEGMVVTAIYSDGSSKELTSYDVTYTAFIEAGETVVTVMHEGKTAEFTVTVALKEMVINEDSGYEINEDNGFISGIAEKTDVSDFISNFGNDVTVINKDGQALAEGDKVSTGCKVIYAPFGETVQELTVIVKGDLSGDGKIGSVDFMRIRSAFLNTYAMTEAERLAADINGDGKINSNDFMFVRRHFLGIYNIFA